MKRIIPLLLALLLILAVPVRAEEADVPTEKEVYEAMIALQDTYPEGTPWTNDNYYEWNGGIYTGGYGCVAFAFELSDTAFGNLPARRIDEVVFENVRVGDILRLNNDTHSAIVLETYEGCVVLAEGSYNDTVHWGRIVLTEAVEGADYLLTRYPEGSGTGDDQEESAVPSIIPGDAVIIGSGNCGSGGLPNVKWSLCDDGTLYLTGFGPSCQYSYACQHGVYCEYGPNCTYLSAVPGWYDSRDSVTRVLVQDGITEIGSGTFMNHSALTQVSLPDSVETIGAGAFANSTALAEINLPAKLKTISSGAFLGCTGLKKLDFPQSLESINNSAFEHSGLEEALLPEGLRYLGHYAFSECDSLVRIHIPSTVLNNIQYLCYGSDALVEASFAEGLTEIGRYSFMECTSLKTLVLPSTLTSIGELAFRETAVENLALPDGLETLRDNAFENCRHLKTLYIPNTIASFGNNVFAGCKALTDVTVEEGLTDLGGATFCDCESLRTFEFPKSITRIGPALFQFSGLIYMEIPNTITEIGALAFAHTDYLRVLTIPSTVTKIGQAALDRADLLPCIYFDGTKEQYDAIEFQFDDDLAVFFDIVLVDRANCAHTESKTLGASIPTCYLYKVSEATLCADCGKILNAPELIEEYGHSWSDWFNVNQTTQVRSCLDCRAYETRPIQEPSEPQEPDSPVKFRDVAEGSWYADAVSWAVNLGVTNGIGDGLFGPDTNCTRAQVVTFLWRAAGSPEPASSTNPFTDVDASQWYGKAVLWAVEKGITNGMTATTFGTDQTCTRAQVATFLWRAQGQPEPGYSGNPFRDVDPASWYGEAVLWAVVNGITNGMGQGTFAPDGTCTRGQIVTFLYRAIA